MAFWVKSNECWTSWTSWGYRWIIFQKQLLQVVATQIFLWFSPRTLGKMNPFWRAYFSKGLKPPTRQSFFFSRLCCYRIGFQTHDEDMCSIRVGEDMVEVEHLTTLLCWWKRMVVKTQPTSHKSAPSHWVPGDVKLILEAWCTLTPKPSLILSMTTLPAVMFLRSEVKGQGPFVGL